MEIVCKSYTLREVDISTTPIGAHKPFGFSSSEVRVLDFPYVKRPLEPHCNNHILVNVSSCHISSQR
jgi:hypothetical protein